LESLVETALERRFLPSGKPPGRGKPQVCPGFFRSGYRGRNQVVRIFPRPFFVFGIDGAPAAR